MKYKAPFGSSDPNAAYIDRNTANAVRGSVPPAAAIEWPQREIVDVIAAAGLTPADSLQLTPAIRALIRGFSGLQYLPTGTNFYVNGATGSNANSGLAANTAFQTIQGAIDAIQANYFCAGSVVINVADGTYSGFVINPSFISSWRVLGNTANPGACQISAIAAGGRGVVVGASVSATIAGFALASFYENLATLSGSITCYNCNFTAPTANQTATIGAYSGEILLYGALRYTGSGVAFVSAGQGGTVRVGYQDALVTNAAVITITGTPAFSSGFAYTEQSASVVVIAAVTTFSGAATGPKYRALLNGSINVQGAGVNFLPGSTAGVLQTGGQYQ